ncbi:GNAT family N-acetyltransferase [Streptomyces sp. SID13031]|nr:GNAT family N-acetyltransferase [Streptomyces sp. SID13031]NEA32763.1 GNAT family N-acetyltransferase [Streptomyces sp. SID13031]
MPAGFSCRAATTADAKTISRLAEIALDEVEATLERPGLDASVDTLVILEPAGDIAAWTYVRGRRSQVDVGPSYRGLGLGSSLLDWAEARAVEIDGEWLAQTVDDEDHAGTALLRARGYDVLATNWKLTMPATENPALPDLPDLPAGITIRPFSAEDRQAAYLVIQNAFDDWQPRRWGYEEWARMSVERSSFTPELSPVAFAGDELVGAAICLALPDSDAGSVEQLAVRRDLRGQGIARALLAHASHGFSRQGRPNLTIWTHSGTGALAMYERLGMTVEHSTTVFSRKL